MCLQRFHINMGWMGLALHSHSKMKFLVVSAIVVSCLCLCEALPARGNPRDKNSTAHGQAVDGFQDFIHAHQKPSGTRRAGDKNSTAHGQAVDGFQDFIHAHQKPSDKRDEEEDLDIRIVGGEEASTNSIPWIVALMLNDPIYERMQFCGGTILNKRTIISAAHCFHNEPTNNPSSIEVALAEHTLDGNEGKEKVIKVSQIISHKDYDNDAVKNDIALLILEEDIPINENMKPIKLTSAASSRGRQRCQIAGWGKLAEDRSGSNVLMRATTDIIDVTECQWAYGSQVDAEKEICATKPGIDTCQGDSGGPLTCEINGLPELVGVVSWGYGCARQDFPGVYTNVHNYLGWINKNKA